MHHRHTTAYEKTTSPPILTFPLMGGKGHLTQTPPP